jgi:hypothetical protein
MSGIQTNFRAVDMIGAAKPAPSTAKAAAKPAKPAKPAKVEEPVVVDAVVEAPVEVATEEVAAE